MCGASRREKVRVSIDARSKGNPVSHPRLLTSLLAPLFLLVLAALALAGSARAAVPTPTCNGVSATIFKPDGSAGRLAGTAGDDVIVGSIGRDTIAAGAGDAVICAGAA